MEVAPYLHFSGRCEEALAAYAKIFDGQVTGINRWGEAPPADQLPGTADKVMHANFEAPGFKFMAADSMHGPVDAGNITMSVGIADVAEGERIFNALAAGGTITMPYAKTFWGATFGMVTDAYGIAWMVNAGMPG
jgi:PhnB protein